MAVLNNIARRCDQIATASVPGSHGTPFELKSSGDEMDMSAVRIYFLRRVYSGLVTACCDAYRVGWTTIQDVWLRL